jgi:hypothetical protein
VDGGCNEEDGGTEEVEKEIEVGVTTTERVGEAEATDGGAGW